VVADQPSLSRTQKKFCIYIFVLLFPELSSYPDQRVKKDTDDLDIGVIGSVSLLQNANLSTQPITSFDWSPDKVSIMHAID